VSEALRDTRVEFVAQRPAQLEEVEGQLLEHFNAARAALLAGHPVVFEVDGADLLGHGSPADAAVAAALVGLTRALALEGERAGWSVNVVARQAGAPADAPFLAEHGLTGQLIHAGVGHLGRVPS
jgi:NAD(P)-dependent dehydrogenase (short-subunit alcohol dehydrogenase family)